MLINIYHQPSCTLKGKSISTIKAGLNTRAVLVLLVILPVFSSILPLNGINANASSYIDHFVLPPERNGVYWYWHQNFSVTQINGSTPEVLVILESNVTVKFKIVNDITGQVVFERTAQDLYAVLSLPPGNYTAYAENHNPVPASGNFYILYLPAPVGIADYGIMPSGGSVEPYVEKFYQVIGIADIYNYSVPAYFNYSSSLQLNTILQVNSVYGSQQLWLQDVVQMKMVDDALTFRYLDNIWNDTVVYGNVSSTLIKGDGQVGFVDHWAPQTFYYYPTRYYTSPLPIQFILIINVSTDGDAVIVRFGYINATTYQTIWYDNVTITVPGLESAYMLVDGYNVTGYGLAYDTELVFAGMCCWEKTGFDYLNATLSLIYYNGSYFVPKAVLPFGIDTGEQVLDLETASGDGGYAISVGYGINVPLTLTQPLSLSIINYTRVVDKGQNITILFSLSGSQEPYFLNVTFEGQNYSYIAYTPGNYYITLPTNAMGRQELVIKAYTLTGQEVTRELTVRVNPPLALKVSARNVTDVGVPVTVNYNVSGGTPPYNVTVLVNGIQQASNTVNFTAPGKYNVTVVVQDSVNATTESSIMITVNPRPEVRLTLSRNVTDSGVPVTIAYNVTGGTKPYKVALLLNGTPINGLTLNVTKPGTYVVEAIVADYLNVTASAKEVLVVNPRPSVSVMPTYQGNLLVNVTSVTVSASVTGGTPPYTFYAFLNGREVYSGPSLQGLKLNVSTGAYNVTVEVVDGLGIRASYTIIVTSSYNYALIGGIIVVAVALIAVLLYLVKRKR